MKNTKEIEKDFNAKRDTYFRDNYVRETKLNYLRRYRNELICNEVDKLNNLTKVLDVGCGPAILYPKLLEKCGEYHALDLIESNLQQILAQNHSDKIRTIHSDLDNFESKEEQYDLIISSGSIEYATNHEQIIQALIGSLKPNGTLIISFPNKRSPYRIWGEYVYKYIKRIKTFCTSKQAPKYKRELFKESFIRKQFPTEKTANLTVKYFGLKMIPQPFDALFIGLDYQLLKYFRKHPPKYFNQLAQEFLIIYNHHK